MKIILSCLCLLASVLSFAQNEKTDWANLGRYSGENKALGEPVAGERRVVFMGNSITEGWKNHDSAFFTDHHYFDRGISGQTTPQMLVRFREDVIDLKPKVVIILAGINDIAGNTGPTPLEVIFKNIVSMVELARASKIKVVLSSVLPAFDFPWHPGLQPAEKVVSLNAMIKDYADKHKIIYADYFSAMADERKGIKNGLSSDGVHPTLEGYKIMEPIAVAAITKAMKRRR